MIIAKGFFLVMFGSAIVVAFFNILNPVQAFGEIKNWSRRVLYNKIDLCTQASYSRIIPGLYLSNAVAAADSTVLNHLNITHVLTIELHRLPKYVFQNRNISTLFIRAADSPNSNILPYFPMANNFIDEGRENGNVLVHCRFGVSRSATLVIAYLMEKYNLTFEQAFTYVRQRRRFINPNPGFVRQLRKFEKMNYEVHGLRRFEAYMNIFSRKHRYKLVSFAAVVVGIVVPIVVLVGL